MRSAVSESIQKEMRKTFRRGGGKMSRRNRAGRENFRPRNGSATYIATLKRPGLEQLPELHSGQSGTPAGASDAGRSVA